MKHRYLISSNHFPLIVTAIANNVTEEDLDAFFQELWQITKQAEANHQKIILINLQLGLQQSHMVRAMTNQIKDFPPSLTNSIQTTCLLIPNPIARGALTALQWLVGAPMQIETLQDLKSMAERIKQLYEQQKQIPPSQLLPYLEAQMAVISPQQTQVQG